MRSLCLVAGSPNNLWWSLSDSDEEFLLMCLVDEENKWRTIMWIHSCQRSEPGVLSQTKPSNCGNTRTISAIWRLLRWCGYTCQDGIRKEQWWMNGSRIHQTMSHPATSSRLVLITQEAFIRKVPIRVLSPVAIPLSQNPFEPLPVNQGSTVVYICYYLTMMLASSKNEGFRLPVTKLIPTNNCLSLALHLKL